MNTPTPILVVDGFNLLLALVERERVRLERGEIEAAQQRLLDLLEAWAEARNTGVVLVWDGAARAGRDTRGRPHVRVAFIDPPAEADDWIVLETHRLCEQRTPVQVITRDRGLQDRLPSCARIASLDTLVADLYALIHDPLRAPHVGGRPGVDPEEVPASKGPVNTRLLPRRRHPRRLEEDGETLPPPPASRSVSRRTPPAARVKAAVADAAAEREQRARKEAATRKKHRQQKYLDKQQKMSRSNRSKKKRNR